MFCDDIQDMDLTSALQSLMTLSAELLSALSADITACIKSKVSGWISSQAAFIQDQFENICWKAEFSFIKIYYAVDFFVIYYNIFMDEI